VPAGSGGSVAAGGAVGATGGAVGATGGAVGASGGAVGASGGALGTGGAAPAYCASQTPKTLPFKIVTGGAYVPSGWFPATGPADMTAKDCPKGPIVFGDAGAAGPAGDAGAPPTFSFCMGVLYKQADPSHAFAGINWVPNNAPPTPASCFKGVTALEFWAAGTPGATVTFEAQGTTLKVLLSTTWTKYRIAIADLDLLTGGVQTAFTVGFNSDPTVTGPGPVYLYYADPVYVAN
jgi:hypothetical protein